jgi:hypothetical protein
MSISSTGLYGSATIVNSDLFNDVESLKEQVTTLSTSYLTTTQEYVLFSAAAREACWNYTGYFMPLESTQ